MKMTEVRLAFPAGHFYSPIVDPGDAGVQRALNRADSLSGIDVNDDSHRRILGEVFPKFMADFDYPDDLPDSDELSSFYLNNSQFGWLDARLLFVLLRELSPRRIIEVGSGYSSLLMADVNRRFLDGRIDIRCIEPYPRPFLQRPV